MEPEEIARIYTSMLLSGKDRPRVGRRDPQWKYVLRFLPESRGAHILDAGCGNGHYALALSENGYKNVTAIDLFDTLETGAAFRYRRNSIDAIDLPDASVAFVYTFSVIFYLPDPADGLKEFYRVMKPGAALVISAHTKYSLFTLERVILRWLGWARHLNGVRFYSTGAYVRMLRSAGFDVLDVDGYRLLWAPRAVRNLAMRFVRGCARVCRARVAQGGSSEAGPARVSAPRKPKPPPKWLKKLRSIFGYHLLIAARKPDGAPLPGARG